MIDFHCHLDLFEKPHEVARAVESSGAYILSVTTTPRAFPKTARLIKGSGRVRTALGLHPQLASERAKELSLFEYLIKETRYVGEVGLDGGREFKSSALVQKKVFSQILSFCEANGGRVISIHSRHAAEDVLDTLRRKPDCGTPVLHWFSGGPEELERAISQGCWFSVNRPMAQSKKGRAIIERLPKNRVLTETDAPFTGLGIIPAIQDVQKTLARIWSVSEAEAEAMLHRNLDTLVSAVSANRVGARA